MSHVALDFLVLRTEFKTHTDLQHIRTLAAVIEVASCHSGPPRWMNSISSAAIGLLRYLAGSRWIEANVSGVPEIGVKGLDIGGGAAAKGDVPCCGRLTASVFNASWALGFGTSCLLGNLIRGIWGRTAWITRAAGAAILELTLLPMTTSQQFHFRYDELLVDDETVHKMAPLLRSAAKSLSNLSLWFRPAADEWMCCPTEVVPLGQISGHSLVQPKIRPGC